MANDTDERTNEPESDRTAQGKREHDRDREEMRGRERDRQREREHDREGYRARERSRERRYGDYRGYGDVVRDINRLAYAFSRASAQVYFGTTRVVGDLLLNLTDTWYYPERDYDDDRDEDRGQRNRGYGTRAGRRVDTIEEIYNDVSDNLSDAVRDQADVLARSADEFAAVYDDEYRKDTETEEEPEPGPGASAHERKSGSTERRRRHRRHAADES